MKNFILILFNTFIFFLIINILIVFSWPIYSKYKSNKHNFIDEQIKLLDLNDKDLVTFHNETWKNYDKFRFIPFLGHSETFRKGKFVNFNEEDGRYIVRPNQCKKYVHLYGGSTTFGYNVTDKQTIGSYLQNILKDGTCIFNHGRAYYYSKQENNLFLNHLENRKKIDLAIFIDGVNERCGGYEYQNHINNSFSLLVERPYKMWKRSLNTFLLTLPISQFVNSLKGSNRWINDNENNILNISSCKNKILLNDLFDTRIKAREAICKENEIKCLSFLQPMAGSHGVQISKLLSKSKESKLIEKYNILSKSKRSIDIGYILNEDRSLSYIDAVHYSPQSNKKIAEEIYKYINKIIS